MNRNKLIAVLIAIALPVASSLIVHRYSDKAIPMPKRYFYDTVLTKVENGRSTPDTQWHKIRPFKLKNQFGREVSLDEWKDKIIIVDFFFTSCAGPCPMMSRKMRRVQDAVADYPEVRLVSFTVDPARDTPPVIAGYARKFSADPARWFFLTGRMEQIHELSRNVFMLGDVKGDLEHSTRFVLVDRRSRIRGFYQSSESEDMKRLTGDIKLLLKEPV